MSRLVLVWFFCIFKSIYCQVALGPGYSPGFANAVPSNFAANDIANVANNIAFNNLASPIGSIAGNTAAVLNCAAENAALNGLTLAGMPISAVSPIGFGDVAVGGELPVVGSTAVMGNVPVIGFVTFEGIVPAGGMVSLASNCGCDNQILY